MPKKPYSREVFCKHPAYRALTLEWNLHMNQGHPVGVSLTKV